MANGQRSTDPTSAGDHTAPGLRSPATGSRTRQLGHQKGQGTHRESRTRPRKGANLTPSGHPDHHRGHQPRIKDTAQARSSPRTWDAARQSGLITTRHRKTTSQVGKKMCWWSGSKPSPPHISSDMTWVRIVCANVRGSECTFGGTDLVWENGWVGGRPIQNRPSTLTPSARTTWTWSIFQVHR